MEKPVPQPDELSRFSRARAGPTGGGPGGPHGLAFLTEATLQLRDQCGDRRVPGPEVAVVANALGPQCGAMVLIRG